MNEERDQYVQVCPYCGGIGLYHSVCRNCGSVVRSYVKEPEKLLKRKERR